MLEKFNKIYNEIKVHLKASGLTENEIESVQRAVEQKIATVAPPTIAIIGFTGVGKSSTLNALFNAGQPTSDVRACTQNAKVFTGNLEPYTGSKGTINIYDMPGLGESIKADVHHYNVYTDILPKTDVIIWTFHAGDRAMEPMQKAIMKLIDKIGLGFTEHLMFAINKVDAIAPGESCWNESFNIPSMEQKQNIIEFENYIKERIREVLPQWDGPIISYSAKRRYHLEQLMKAMIQTMPSDRRWILNNLADIADYAELISPEYLPYVQQLTSKEINPQNQ